MKKKITAKERAEKVVENTLETFLKFLCKVTGQKFPVSPAIAPKTDDNEEDNENVH